MVKYSLVINYSEFENSRKEEKYKGKIKFRYVFNWNWKYMKGKKPSVEDEKQERGIVFLNCHVSIYCVARSIVMRPG